MMPLSIQNHLCGVSTFDLHLCPMEFTMRRLTALATVLLIMAVAFISGTVSQDDTDLQKARGVVFHDANGNRKFDSGEKPLSGVRISNGEEIVKTNADGKYEIAVTDDTIVFVIKPSGWRTPLNENHLPRFYYNHKPKGSPPLKYLGVAPTGELPKSIDFPLYEQQEPDQFKAILFGDPQPRDQKEIDYIGHDVVEELVGTDATFGVTLGDILFDDLSLFESQARTIALLGIPWYNVIGNHDINYDAKNDRISDETFERNFGPAYYSFDYGAVHFIVLDDVEWSFPEGADKGRYRGGFGERQVEFVKNDLALIPDDQLVVLMMHIPLTDVHDRHGLYRLIEKRPFSMSISGHTHKLEHKFVDKEDGWMGPEPHHHFVNVTVSGSWWSGATDDRSIPHTMCADGTPNGYSIISFDGSQYSLQYRAAGRSADYQVQIHAPEVVTAGGNSETSVFANVFNGSSRSKVDIRIDGQDWQAMTHTIRNDPTFEQVYETEKLLAKEGKPWRDMPSPRVSSHVWESKLPDGLSIGSHLIEVRSTDIFGQSVAGRRIIRVAKQ